MLDSFMGATNYKNQSNKEIIKDFGYLVKCTEKILKDNKKLKRNNIPMDLNGIFNEIILFAEKLIELSNKNLNKLKKGKPSIFFIESLKEIGSNANELFLRIGEIWHGKYNQVDYGSRYKDADTASIKYCEFRDYIGSMMDLGNIGFELERRYFKDGKPLYQDKDWLASITKGFFGALFESLKNFFGRGT